MYGAAARNESYCLLVVLENDFIFLEISLQSFEFNLLVRVLGTFNYCKWGPVGTLAVRKKII